MKKSAPRRGRNGREYVRGSNQIVLLPVTPRKAYCGIGFYRRPRAPGEVIRCLTEALTREARVSDQLGVPISNEVIRDIASWGERGCVP
jgi:hypothetical protein